MLDKPNDNNDLWKIILKLKDILPIEKKAFYLSFPINNLSDGINISEESQIANPNKILISVNLNPNTGWALNVNFSDNMAWPLFENSLLKEKQFLVIKRYLPYVLIRLNSYHKKTAQTIGHLAMSLDGKIATNAGHSQWIGNKRNQIHSHRMRALADAILVGGNTFLKDKPQLNVRHVSGDDPIRIVMGNGDYKFDETANSEDIIWVKSENGNDSNIDELIIGRTDKGFNCKTLLEELFKRNIYSVYIEGGGITLSGFIISKSLDILQLHYAPILMGSGIPCITLPEISEVGEAISFVDHQMEKVEDEWMFTGVLNYDI